MEVDRKYKEKYGLRKGGWRGNRQFKLVEKKLVGENVYSFDFLPVDGYDQGFEYTPG